MIITCDTCGVQFDRKPSNIKLHNYCCRKCLGKANELRSRKPHERICDHCGKKYIQKSRHPTRNKHFYCSQECAWASKVRRILVNCEWCNRTFEKKRTDIARTNHNFCDRDCRQDYSNFAQVGSRDKMVCGKKIYKIFAQRKLNRELAPHEEVHHIDGNHYNNSDDNLSVVTKSEHTKIHAAMKVRDEHGRFIRKG